MPLSPRDSSIILDLRLPRVAAGAIVGAALSIAGAVLQALLRNPLADPYVLGISSGAAVGAVLAILFGLGSTIAVILLIAVIPVMVYNLREFGKREAF